MADARACCADGTTHRARIRWDSHETNTFAEKRTQSIEFMQFSQFSGLFWYFSQQHKTIKGACQILVCGFFPLRKKSSIWHRRLYSFLLGIESTLCKTPHFQWFYGKLNQIYEKLRSDQMDPKPALGGPKPISRTGGSLLKNSSYISKQCIYFSILLDWR